MSGETPREDVTPPYVPNSYWLFSITQKVLPSVYQEIHWFCNSACVVLRPRGRWLRTADVAKLVDAPDLGSGAARCVGSSPSIRTKWVSAWLKSFLNPQPTRWGFLFGGRFNPALLPQRSTFNRPAVDITLDKQDDQLHAILTVNLTEADYATAVESKLKEYSKKAQIKGFRPGKVPVTLVRKMYGKGILVDEINELLGKSVDGYIKENNLRILGEPLPVASDIDFDNQKDFSFQFELGLLPDFELPDLLYLKIILLQEFFSYL